MNANEYAEQVVTDFIRDITDYLFLSIEQDDKKMRDFMTNVDRFGLDTVNKAIGLKIKERLNLANGEKVFNPQSRLIKSYTQHRTQ